MGGFGSGRTGGRVKAEHCRFIEVNRLHREGCLDAGYRQGWAWSREGVKVASIGMVCNGVVLALGYRLGEQDVAEQIPIERVPCRYGGSRPFFRCPGIVNGRTCMRRVGKLFLHRQYFLCRHCHRLAYASQSETELDRLYRKRDKRRAAMGAEPGAWGHVPPRPKGMWHSTYRKRRDAIFAADRASDEAFEIAAMRYLKWL